MAVRRTMVVVVIWVVTRRDAAIGRRRDWVERTIWIARLERRATTGLVEAGHDEEYAMG